jgi:hypothetical protein
LYFWAFADGKGDRAHYLADRAGEGGQSDSVKKRKAHGAKSKGQETGENL